MCVCDGRGGVCVCVCVCDGRGSMCVRVHVCMCVYDGRAVTVALGTPLSLAYCKPAPPSHLSRVRS